jgi:hypothetical protein
LREQGLSKNRDGYQSEASPNPFAAEPHALLSIQIAGHNTAAGPINLAPFLISIDSTYHQIREITSHARGNMKYHNG